MDEFRLESISESHAVATDLFVPFVIRRLGCSVTPTSALLDVELRDITTAGTEHRQLKLVWDASSIPLLPPGVPESTVTEWAALGVASVVLWHFAGARISAVSLAGERFDYWVQRGERRLGLEVSGTLDEDLAHRHRHKVNQWQANPYYVDGFVVAVGLVARGVIFSFHRFLEQES